MYLTLSVPLAVTSGVAARALVELALKQGLEPRSIPRAGMHRVTLYISADLQAALSGQNINGPRLSMLAYAGWAHQRDQAVGIAPPQTPDEIRGGLLSRLDAHAKESAIKGRIGLLEGGTGLGKSRVIARCARSHVERGGRVVVAAPTIVVLSHLLREWEKEFNETPAGSVLLGRDQFVVPGQVRAISPDGPVGLWASEGCARLSPHTRLLSSMLPPEMRELGFAADALTLDPSFPVDDCREIEEDADLLGDAVERMRAFAAESKVIWTTQSMLAIHQRLLSMGRPPLLPDLDLLLVDEAHQLEENTARAACAEASLHMLALALHRGQDAGTWTAHRKGKCVERILDEIGQIERLGRDLGSGRHVFIADARKDLAASAQRAARDLGQLIRVLPPSQARPLVEPTDCLYRFSAGKEAAWIEVSEVRQWVRLVTGPRKVDRHLQSLWKSCSSACLFSGTLFLPDIHGRMLADEMARRLAVPLDRLYTPEPVHPPWSLERIKVFAPNFDQAPVFTYSPESEGPWRARIARAISHVAAQSTGSVLVLCSSYADIQGIQERLAAVDCPLRVLAQSPEMPLSRAAAGIVSRRAVLLTTGAAWTGFDLTAPDGSELLSDLVIPRAPFGLNRSSTQTHRRSHLGFSTENADTALRLRQGIGRLIRQPEGPTRNLWMLDGRIFGESKRHHAIVARLFDRYSCHPLPDEIC